MYGTSGSAMEPILYGEALDLYGRGLDERALRLMVAMDEGSQINRPVYSYLHSYIYHLGGLPASLNVLRNWEGHTNAAKWVQSSASRTSSCMNLEGPATYPHGQPVSCRQSYHGIASVRQNIG